MVCRDAPSPLTFCSFPSRAASSSSSLGEQQNWDVEAEGVSGLEIDHQFYLGALLDWEVSRLGALKNFSNVDRCLLI